VEKNVSEANFITNFLTALHSETPTSNAKNNIFNEKASYELKILL